MTKQKHTRSRPKLLYRVKNWSEYDQALVQRGSLTIWLSDEVSEKWRYTGEQQRGAQFEDSDWAITMMWTLKKLFHVPNRATAGFVRAIFGLMGVDLPVPDHTTLSRRGKGWNVRFPKKVSGHLDIIIDSTELKVFSSSNCFVTSRHVKH
ncbi:transposase [Chloroflexus sp.]|uniref:transposase n=1 Tax=Chloroflexus sp. TaxID=1904827 RepID=UPI003D0FA04D